MTAGRAKGRGGFAPRPGSLTACFRPCLPPCDLVLTFRFTVRTTQRRVTAEVTAGVSGHFQRAVTRTVTPFRFREKYEMPLIQKQKREVKRPITVKLEQDLAERLNTYARFLESSRDHVIGSIVKYVMDRDRDFAAYVAANKTAGSVAEGAGAIESETAAKAGS